MKRLDNLQILRGIAASLVVVDHALLAAAANDPAYVSLGHFAATMGRMGVNVFFIISGFIMVHSTEATRQMAPIARVQDFVRKRATRLLPLYWIATFVQIAVSAIAGAYFTVGHILLSLSFLPNFPATDDARLPPVLGVGWTLNYEIFFYCLFAATLMLPRRIGLVTCILTITALVAAGVLGMRYTGDGELHRIFFFYTFKNMLFFAIGMSLAMGQSFLPRFTGGWPLAAALALMAGALAFFQFLRFNDGDPLWQAISLLVCTTALVLALSDYGKKVFTGYRTILHIGNASFSTYLFHAMILGALAPVEARLLKTGMGPIFIMTGSLLCLAVGSTIHRFVEMPLTQMARRAFAGTRATGGSEKLSRSVILDA